MKVHSHVIRYGDHVDTDVIIPARYLASGEEAVLAAHCMEDLDPDFQQKRQTCQILVAGRNFGCGSSREHAPLAIRGSGIRLVIAESFARIFYRNSIDIGLAIVESPEAAADIRDGDEVEADLSAGVVINHRTGRRFAIAPFPPFIQDIIDRGGIAATVRARLERERA